MSQASRPFRVADVKFGDRLVLTRHESVGLRFKFMGLGGAVVATWEEPPKSGPIDVICRQRDVRIPPAQMNNEEGV